MTVDTQLYTRVSIRLLKAVRAATHPAAILARPAAPLAAAAGTEPVEGPVASLLAAKETAPPYTRRHGDRAESGGLMPTPLRVEGFRFFFFSNEGQEPPHVHVSKGDGVAKLWLAPLQLLYARAHAGRASAGARADAGSRARVSGAVA